MRRFAVYYAPAPGAPLHDFGSRWLGRDAATGQLIAQPRVPGLDLADITAAPRLYGFHATLKAPFGLAEGRTAAELDAAGSSFAQSARTVVGSVRLAVRRLGAWLALVPEVQPPEITELAFDVVRDFDPFRAALSPLDRARRRPETLTRRQRELLELWGYPYVAEAFEFHMTLAGPSEGPMLDRLEPILREAWNEAGIGPVDVDAIAIFEQPAEGKPFIMRSRHGLTAPSRRLEGDKA